MKKLKKEKQILHPYSEESIALKMHQLYLLSIFFKTIILSPLLYLIIRDIVILKFNISININDLFLKLIVLIIAIVLSLLTTKKELIKNPLFLDDEVVISNKKKSNGNYEDISTNKFKILLGLNIACLIPLCFILALTISSLICLIFDLIPNTSFIIPTFKYILTIILFNISSNTFNDALIKYLRINKN